METVKLDTATVLALRDVMPVPAACGAGAVASSVEYGLRALNARIGVLEDRLDDLLASPRRRAARERYVRGKVAAVAGWHEEAADEFSEAIRLDPYHAASHLALGYMQIRLHPASSEGPTAAWREPLAAAVRYGAVTDPPSAARAALVLAAALRDSGEPQAAADELVRIARAVPSAALALAAARATADADWEGEIRRRAPALVEEEQDEDFGDPAAVAFGQPLQNVLEAAAQADVDLDTSKLPRLEDRADRRAAAGVVAYVRSQVAARWPVTAEELRDRLAAREEALAAAAARLDAHLAKEAVFSAGYIKHAAELEAAVAAAESELKRCEEEIREGRLDARQALDRALSELDPAAKAPDDAGIVPIPPGLEGLP